MIIPIIEINYVPILNTMLLKSFPWEYVYGQMISQ